MQKETYKKKYTKPTIRKTKVFAEFFTSRSKARNFDIDGMSLLEAHWQGSEWST